MAQINQQWDILSKRFGELVSKALVRDDMVQEMRGTIMRIQNDTIEEKLGGLEAAFEKAGEIGQGVAGEPKALVDEYKALLAKEGSLSSEKDARLKELDDMKSAGANKLASPKDGLYYDGVGEVMATIIDPDKRAGFIKRLGSDKYNLEQFPEARADFVKAALSAQATARLRLANQVLDGFLWQGGQLQLAPDIADRVKQWQSEAAAWGLPRDPQKLQGFLHDPAMIAHYSDREGNKAYDNALRDISSGSPVAAVAGKHQLIDMTGNLLVTMVLENPELLKKGAVKKAVKAMQRLESAQLEDAASVTPRMNAEEKTLFKVEMQDLLRAHKGKGREQDDPLAEEKPSSLFGKLSRLVMGGVQSVLRLFGRAVDKVSPLGRHSHSDAQRAADDVIMGVAVATHMLARGESPPPPESVKEIETYLFRIEEQLGLDPLRDKLASEMQKAREQAEKSHGR